MFRGSLVLVLALYVISCRKDAVIPVDKEVANYIIIGHAYGTPSNQPPALYEKLVPQLAFFHTTLQPNKFIFTGDVTYTGTEENWQSVLFQLDSLDIDFWVAPGNHEFYTDYFSTVVQPELFFTRRIGSNMFIILNTNFNGWTIDQPQIDMLDYELSNIDDVDNIFVFTHQVWWANDENAKLNLETVFPNSNALQNGPTNFWTDAFPLFESLENKVYFFAGDVGTWSWVPNYNFQRSENFYFYASGIGSGIDDNVLHLKIFESGHATIDKIDF